MTEKTKNWTEEKTAKLLDIVGSATPVSAESVADAAEQLDISERSVASKLRSLKLEVASLAVSKASPYTAEMTEELRSFVTRNAGQYTYAQIAEQVLGGAFTSKQIQGKILSMELTGMVKPSEKVEAVKMYTEAEEAVFVKMAQAGAFIEDIAAKLGKTIASIRGKALSLVRSEQLNAIPVQKESHAVNKTDGLDTLGAKIADMTVSEIAEALGKTDRGVRTSLTRRKLVAKDYNGVAKSERAETKRTAVA